MFTSSTRMQLPGLSGLQQRSSLQIPHVYRCTTTPSPSRNLGEPPSHCRWATIAPFHKYTRFHRRSRLQINAQSSAFTDQEAIQQQDGRSIPSSSSQPSSQPPPPPPPPSSSLLSPATVTSICLDPESSLPAAFLKLKKEVSKLSHNTLHRRTRSGVIRIEIPVPRTVDALQWLRSQQQQHSSSSSSSSPLDSSFPRVYFSPRRSPAADTPGSRAATAAMKGCGATAGMGAVRSWQGTPGHSLDEAAMADMQRFLATNCPRVRVFGCSRFDAKKLPMPEWEEFGSWYFFIPMLEVGEVSGASVLACTVAWCNQEEDNNNNEVVNYTNHGFSTVQEAVQHALLIFDQLSSSTATMSKSSAAHPQAQRTSISQSPNAEQWLQGMQSVHSQLEPCIPSSNVSEGGGNNVLLESMLKIHPEAAREEYLLNGQQGLDELLAALDLGGGSNGSGSNGGGGFSSAFEAVVVPPLEASIDDTETEDDGEDGDAYNGTSNSNSNGTTGATSSSKKKPGLTKVVLARQTRISLHQGAGIDPYELLAGVAEKDPRAYQIALQLPSGTTFIASTPERLYARTGRSVSSEAIAGTRARGPIGDVERDFWLAFDLLRSQKDHVEFTVVRDWVAGSLARVCSDVKIEVGKSVLKQGNVQHLYGIIAGTLPDTNNDGSNGNGNGNDGINGGNGISNSNNKGTIMAPDAALLAALHPTPAVCGRPRSQAIKFLSESEPFDRGLYGGPFGWMSKDAAEFVVAIRSALIGRPGLFTHDDDGSNNGDNSSTTTTNNTNNNSSNNRPSSSSNKQHGAGEEVALYAGVGIVVGSDTRAEWAELDLKVKQYQRLITSPTPLSQAPNINMVWAQAAVEELCRLGCNTFCVAPGSRSSPLTAAIAAHPRTRIITCIDERSLGFWALGHGRATGRPAVVVTTSGTAVANLLPAVVEASQSNVPLLLLTGDRPAELRDTGANQTIDQVEIFGKYTRWFVDLPAPIDSVPARMVISTIDTAVARAAGGGGGGGDGSSLSSSSSSGPVHINCQLREPLAPTIHPWDPTTSLQGLDKWMQHQQPYTTHIAMNSSTNSSIVNELSSPDLMHLIKEIQQQIGGEGRQHSKGLIVIGELVDPNDVVAAAQFARLLGWPVVADVLSGLRVGVEASSRPGGGGGGGVLQQQHNNQQQPLAVLDYFDHMLLDQQHWETLKPDVVVQIGGHLTSKRLAQFLEWSALDGSKWIFADKSSQRHDQSHLLSCRIQCSPSQLIEVLLPLFELNTNTSSPSSSYGSLMLALNEIVGQAIHSTLDEMSEQQLTEPHVARIIAQKLPPGEAIFVGNSMPIRDLDMFASPRSKLGQKQLEGASSSSASAVGVVECSTIGAPIAANRGASGIDGVLSTAAGFADGLSRGVTLYIGDISFLHDINGLNLLRSQEAQPPLTVVLVNNGGGGIFSFLPIADAVDEDVFNPLWATPQRVDLGGMCRAQGIPHLKVASAEELTSALQSAWGMNRHSVIEVMTTPSRDGNVARHREIQAAAKVAFTEAMYGFELIKSSSSSSNDNNDAEKKAVVIAGVSIDKKTFELKKHVTSISKNDDAESLRYALYLRLSASISKAHNKNESSKTPHPSPSPISFFWQGLGEVAPLPGLHTETTSQAQSQLILLSHKLTGIQLPDIDDVITTRGRAIHTWLENVVGINPASVYTSVMSGLEFAVLDVLSHVYGFGGSLEWLNAGSLENAIITSNSNGENKRQVRSAGLLDCQDSSEKAAAEAVYMVNILGYNALKIKVGRGGGGDASSRDDNDNNNDNGNSSNIKKWSPPGHIKDVQAVLAIRAAVGPDVILRADANRKWSVKEAAEFSDFVKLANLEYLEEPLYYNGDGDDDGLEAGWEAINMNVAVDESIANGAIGPYSNGSDSSLPDCVTAVVLKPAQLGVVKTLELADWARKESTSKRKVVISSSFESPAGIEKLTELARVVDTDTNHNNAVYHGLGTADWYYSLQRDKGTTTAMNVKELLDKVHGRGHPVLQLDGYNNNNNSSKYVDQFFEFNSTSNTKNNNGTTATSTTRCKLHFIGNLPHHHINSSINENTEVVVFLHGFMGSAEDWVPFMEAYAAAETEDDYNYNNGGKKQRYCIAISLPGHGLTDIQHSTNTAAAAADDEEDVGIYSISSMAGIIKECIAQHPVLHGCKLVGYSLGGRVALNLHHDMMKMKIDEDDDDDDASTATATTITTKSMLLNKPVVIISSSFGMGDGDGQIGEEREARARRDDALAEKLVTQCYNDIDKAKAFLREEWYGSAPLWASLRAHPRYNAMIDVKAAKLAGLSLDRLHALARVLSEASPGRSPNLLGPGYYNNSSSIGGGRNRSRGDEKEREVDVVFIAGELDDKYSSLAKEVDGMQLSSSSLGGLVETRIVPQCGHACHIEQPLELLKWLL